MFHERKVNGFKSAVKPAPAVILAKKPQPRSARQVPHSIESEQGAIGCALIDPAKVIPAIAAAGFTSEAFYDLRHRTIIETLIKMADANEPVDFITVTQKMKDSHTLEAVGGTAYLNALQDSVPSASNLTYYLEILEEKFLLRRMIQLCEETAAKAYAHQGGTDMFVDEFEHNALSLGLIHLKQAGIKTHVQEAVSYMEDKFNRKGAISGLSTGFPDLDRVTDGLCEAELIVPAAYPGDGKTSLSMNFVEHAILAQNHPVAVFSQEMTSRQLVVRMLCSISKVNGKNIGRGNLLEEEFPRLIGAAGKLAKSSLHIVEDAENIQQIVAASRRLKQEHGIKLIIVDYLQLVTGGGNGRDSNREQEISGVAASLKRLAKELRLPIVAPSQLTDEGKLRESRAIGQHADLILKLEPQGEQENGDVQAMGVFVEKNRNGPSKVTVNLTFLKQFTRFESAAKVEETDQQY